MFARLALAQKWSCSQSPSNDVPPLTEIENGDVVRKEWRISSEQDGETE